MVTTGIYAWSRHPSYFGFFLFSIGGQVILGNIICMFVYIYTLWKFFFDRIEYEEMFLIDFFGEAYKKYK